MLYQETNSPYFHAIALATGKQTLVSAGSYDSHGFRLSPDMRYVAFLGKPTQEGRDQNTTFLYLEERPQRKLRPCLRQPEGGDFYEAFCWSPDGRYLAATSCAKDKSFLYIVEAKSSKVRHVTTVDGGLRLWTWSKNGRWLIAAHKTMVALSVTDGTMVPLQQVKRFILAWPWESLWLWMSAQAK